MYLYRNDMEGDMPPEENEAGASGVAGFLPDPAAIPRPVARLVATALCLLAAVAVAMATISDGEAALFVGGGVLVAGVICAILADQLLGQKSGGAIATILGWFVAAVFMVTVSLVISCAFFDTPKPLACLFNRSSCETVLAQGTPAAVPPQATPAIEASMDRATRASYRVFIQFADYRRETIIDLARQLAAQGWNVQGANEGGERKDAAKRLFEVRYRGDDERIAAEQLARELTASSLPGGPRTAVARPVRIIRPNTLEVWIGAVQPPGARGS
jgi:hypothetical protein